MSTDPICGMTVDPSNAAGSSVFDGQTYCFCSPGCKKMSDANPQNYVAMAPAHGVGVHCC